MSTSDETFEGATIFGERVPTQRLGAFLTVERRAIELHRRFQAGTLLAVHRRAWGDVDDAERRAWRVVAALPVMR